MWMRSLLAFGCLLLVFASSPAAGQSLPAEIEFDPRVRPLPHAYMGPFVQRPDGAVVGIERNTTIISRDGGRTWDSVPVFSDPQQAAAIDIRPERTLLCTRNGTLILAFTNDREKRWTWSNELRDAPGAVLPTYVMRSTDGGRTWRDLQKLHDDWTGAVRDSIETRDGRILFTTMKILHAPGRHAVLTYSSDDDGVTWRASNLIDLGGQGHHGGVTEPTLVERSDGSIWMLIRTNWGEFWTAESFDGGRFWRVLKPSGIAASSAPGMVTRLASGWLVLVWNRLYPEGGDSFPLSGGDGLWSEVPVSNHREELSIAFSDDDGRNWSQPVVLARQTGKWLAYPYVFEAEPGALWITTMQGNVRIEVNEPDLLAAAADKVGETAAELPRPAWKAGLARAVITPDTAVWLAGYGTKRPPDGKLHDLWMKALALEDVEGRRVVLITSDFQGVPRSMSDRVFAQLRERFALERRDVLLTFSHNHCGPRLGDDLVDYYPVEAEQVELVREYTDRMVTRCVEMVGQALASLAPAHLHLGEGRATFAVNRRNNREADVPDLIARGEPLVGPVDHSVPVLKVSRPDGALAAIVFGYACHPTTLSFLTWCGDYPGFAQLELERRHPGAVAMFVNTCGGDQNPLPRRTVELCEGYGRQLAAAVEAALQQPLRPVSSGVRTAFAYVDLPYLEVMSREQLRELTSDGNAIKARWAGRLLGKLDAGESFESVYPYPVHAWRLGEEMLVIGMGAETVVDYALRFKQQYGPGTWVCGYTDDMIAYIPSRRVWEEGGYEGGWSLYEYGRPALRWAGDVEERIAATVERLVGEVKE